MINFQTIFNLIISKLNNFIIDTLFPISCLVCKKGNEFICTPCLSQIPLKSSQKCPICEKMITPDGKTCFGCKSKFSIDGILVSASYKNETVSRLIHYFKYGFIEKIAEPLGKILLKSIMNSDLPIPDAIIPVPLHKKRLRWRGFNQAELLAGFLAKNIAPGFEVPVFNGLLIRKKKTKPQMKIKDAKTRKKNIEGAFRIEKNNYRKNLRLIKNKSILLIDDVTTTGNTLFECAKVLKKAGAKEVFALVVARQGFN